jgi:hypothetical protein
VFKFNILYILYGYEIWPLTAKERTLKVNFRHNFLNVMVLKRSRRGRKRRIVRVQKAQGGKAYDLCLRTLRLESCPVEANDDGIHFNVRHRSPTASTKKFL